jgi:hypothetical protein
VPSRSCALSSELLRAPWSTSRRSSSRTGWASALSAAICCDQSSSSSSWAGRVICHSYSSPVGSVTEPVNRTASGLWIRSPSSAQKTSVAGTGAGPDSSRATRSSSFDNRSESFTVSILRTYVISFKGIR